MRYAILETEKGTDNIIDRVYETGNYFKTVEDYLKGRLQDFIRVNTFEELYDFDIFEEYAEYQTLIDIKCSEDVTFESYKKEFERVVNQYDDHKDIQLIQI